MSFASSFPSIYEKVFDYVLNLSPEYIRDVCTMPRIAIQNSAYFLQDGYLPYATIKNGARKTTNAPEEAQHTIFMLGNSALYGFMCEDNGTVASFLQTLCNKNFSNRYTVRNYGIPNGVSWTTFALQIPALPIKENDIVILYNHGIPFTVAPNNKFTHNWIMYLYALCLQKKAKFCFVMAPQVEQIINPTPYEMILMNSSDSTLSQDYKDFINGKAQYNISPPKHYLQPELIRLLLETECPCLDGQLGIERPHQYGEIFSDIHHLSAKGNKLIALQIFNDYLLKLNNYKYPNTEQQNMIFSNLSFENMKCQAHQSMSNLLKKEFNNNTSIRNWLDNIKKDKFSDCMTIGAIIMNCNPFTNGHLYLIEKALESVDSLYIFLVEENKSEFAFSDRMSLIKQGTSHLSSRVKIFPSGKFIISSITFPGYFVKSTAKDDSKVDSSNDIAIFGAIIAPELNITVRFVGEEPICVVTNQYNKTMKTLLPYLGIQVREIPRISLGQNVISASYVRKLLKQNKWDELKKLVPNTTFDFLKKLNQQLNSYSYYKLYTDQEKWPLPKQHIYPTTLQTIKNILFQPLIKKKAFALCNSGKLDEAEQLAKSIIGNTPYMAWAYYILAKVQWQKQNYAESLENIHKAIEIAPQTKYFTTYKNARIRELKLISK